MGQIGSISRDSHFFFAMARVLRKTRVTKEGKAITDPSRRTRVIFRESEEATSSKKEMTEVIEGMYIFYFY